MNGNSTNANGAKYGHWQVVNKKVRMDQISLHYVMFHNPTNPTSRLESNPHPQTLNNRIP